jgi:hypothetical protein
VHVGTFPAFPLPFAVPVCPINEEMLQSMSRFSAPEGMPINDVINLYIYDVDYVDGSINA